MSLPLSIGVWVLVGMHQTGRDMSSERFIIKCSWFVNCAIDCFCPLVCLWETFFSLQKPCVSARWHPFFSYFLPAALFSSTSLWQLQFDDKGEKKWNKKKNNARIVQKGMRRSQNFSISNPSPYMNDCFLGNTTVHKLQYDNSQIFVQACQLVFPIGCFYFTKCDNQITKSKLVFLIISRQCFWTDLFMNE